MSHQKRSLLVPAMVAAYAGGMAQDVGQFFDKHAEAYRGGDHPMTRFHEVTARTLQRKLRGRVLCVGGLWAAAKLDGLDAEILIVDLSGKMLQAYAEMGLATQQANALDLPFAGGSFDHVVLPLVIHHINHGTGRSARVCARAALAEAHRVLCPGGRVWVSEFCVPPIVYSVELFSARVTAWTLAKMNIPLVVMHSERFYMNALCGAGFSRLKVQRITSASVRALDPISPVIGLPWFRVPRFAYPIRPTLFSATRAAY